MKSAMVFVAVIISTILFWATSNVCKYNFAVEKRTNILTVLKLLDLNLTLNLNILIKLYIN